MFDEPIEDFDNDRSRMTDIRDSTLRGLGDTVNKLSVSIKNLSAATIKAGGRGIAGATRGAGLTAPSLAGVAVGSTVSPIIGTMVKELVSRHEDSFVSSFKNMAASTKDALLSIRRKNQTDVTAMHRNYSKLDNIEQRMADNDFDSSGMGDFSSNKLTNKNKKRMQLDSYSDTYPSSDLVEAIDKLRMSNAEWLKAVGTLSKPALKRKKLPAAAVGGIVRSTGEALVHKGEVIVPTKMVKTQTETLLQIRDKLDQQAVDQSKIMKGLEEHVVKADTSVDLLISKTGPFAPLLSVVKMFAGGELRARVIGEHAVGKSQRYHFYAVRGRNTIETIANATSATYASSRTIGERQISLLKYIAEGLTGKSPGWAKKWGSRLRTPKMTFFQMLKQQLMVPDSIPLEDMLGTFKRTPVGKSVTNIGSRVGSAIASPFKGAWARLKGAFSESPKESEIPKAAKGGRVRRTGKAVVHTGEAIIPAADVDLQTSILGQIRDILFGSSKIHKSSLKEIKKQTKHEIIESRYEEHERKKHLEWMRKNNISESLEGVKRGISNIEPGKGMSWLQTLMLRGGIPGVGLLGKGMTKFGGKVGTKGALGTFARVAGRGFRSGRGVAGSLSKGAKAAFSFSKRAGMIGKVANVGSKVLGGATKIGGAMGLGAGAAATGGGLMAGLTAATGGTAGIVIALVMALIDGVIGVFKTGDIFKKAFKDTTVQERMAAFAGGVVEGLWSMVRLPFNLIMKMIGSDQRLQDITEPAAKMIYKFIDILSPFIEKTMLVINYMMKWNKLVGGTLATLIAATPMLLFKPDMAMDMVSKAMIKIIDFFFVETPKFLLDMAVNLLIKTPIALAKLQMAIGKLILWTLPRLFEKIIFGLIKMKFSLEKKATESFRQGFLNAASNIWEYIKEIPKKLKLWFIDKALGFVQGAIDFSAWAESIVDSVNAFTDSLVERLLKIDEYITMIPIYTQKLINKIVGFLDNLITGKGFDDERSLLGTLANALWVAFKAIVWQIPKALVVGLSKALFRLMTEVPFIAWAVFKNVMSALFIQLPIVVAKGLIKIDSKIRDLVSTAIEKFIIDPIILVITTIGNYIKSALSKIPVIGKYFAKATGRSTETSTITGDAVAKASGNIFNKAKASVIDRLTPFKTSDVQRSMAVAQTMNESAILRNNAEVGAKSASAIGEASHNQVNAITETTNTIISTNNNNGASPFTQSPLWTQMGDAMTGDAI